MRKPVFVALFACAAFSLAATTTPERAAVARRAAAESIVLLKNESPALPLEAGSSVAVVGPVFEEYYSFGFGSAQVRTPYVVTVEQGLVNAGFKIDPDCRDTAVFVLSRVAEEGVERENLGDFYLTAAECTALGELKAKGFRRLVVLLNVGTFVSLQELKNDPAITSILYVSYPGVEGGNAIADVLSGKVNPSGRLSATMAAKLEDYPSDCNWQEALQYVPYEEDIFVGYRYFHTIPGAAAKVTYSFGYGLSYTTFALSEASVAADAERVTVRVKVTNTGKLAGRDSVLVYSSNRGGKAQHAAKELRAFAKTQLLPPGGSETLELGFAVSDLAYFDDEGVSGKIGSWVVDAGTYELWVGGAPDDCIRAGEFEPGEKLLSTPGFRLEPARLARRLRADGTYREVPVVYGDKNGPRRAVQWPKSRPPRETRIMLQAVARGERTLDEFVDQLPLDDLFDLLGGQTNILSVGNTRSIGVLPEYGVPGLQTADGPVGIRLGRSDAYYKKNGVERPQADYATAFPATALTACSFDVALQEEYGRVLGQEAVEVGIDIHLAPGVCISRHPMCGRNFEYMGEDPYLAGRMAAAYIRGVQSQGVASTIKHFAGNNRENARLESYDVASERALREIYLRAFEIAVKEAKPKCLMTSYNGINAIRSGANFGLIEGILRGEWGYEGLVMTDWSALTQFWETIAAGNDVKMPQLSRIDVDKTKRVTAGFARQGVISRERIRECAKRVLKLVMASPRFQATLRD